MEIRVGEQSVGEFARRQLEAAREDPRLARADGRAMIADFWDAIEEAERVRTLGLMGMEELTHSLEREERRLEVKRDSEQLTAAQARSLQAAFERTEWAKAELANESPHANAQALISMTSALDAMVEELVKHWREVLVERIARHVLDKSRERAGATWNAADSRVLEAVEDVIGREAERMVPSALRPAGKGTERYEKPLARIGLEAPADRPIPLDLDAALAELGALRDVLVHRAGRVDERALRHAPDLPYEAGQLVRLSRQDYRRYSAAVRCYAQEICYRGIRNWPETSEEEHGPNLEGWREYVLVNA